LELIDLDVPFPENEIERLVALQTYDIMDSPSEPAYDDITELAAEISRCPVAAITMIDESREWLKSNYGLSADLKDLPRDGPCSVALCEVDLLVIPDLTKDERFSDHPTVIGEPHFRFYCGMPLINLENYALGTMCVLDYEPRNLEAKQAKSIRRLAGQVMAQLELRRLLIKLEKAHIDLKELNQTLEKKVADQVTEIERVSRFKRYFSPQVAKTILEREEENPFATHRREVTVVFIDLRGFTNFSDSVEPEEVIDFLRTYHAEMGKLIFEHEGTLEHFAGDGIMVFFNDPIPRENHTEVAARLALKIQERAKELRPEWQKKGYDLDVGIGLAAGYATLGTIGFEGRMDYGAIGNVPIMACRLSSEAKGGQILTNQKTAGKIENVVDADSVGELQLKGFARPVAGFQITGLKG
jgi:class 3 adenylate cyclase